MHDGTTVTECRGTPPSSSACDGTSPTRSIAGVGRCRVPFVRRFARAASGRGDESPAIDHVRHVRDACTAELVMRFPLVLIPFALAACGSDNPAAPTVACQTAITATVGTGTTPRFDWSPACGITAISVIA